MNQLASEISGYISEVNGTIFFSLLFIWLLADNAHSFELNLPFILGLVAVSALVAVLIAYGFNGLNYHKEEIDFKSKIKYVELVPNVLGFVLLGVGAYLNSFYTSKSTIDPPSGSTLTYYVHPYHDQAMLLFVAGTAIVLLSVALYHYLIPKQIIPKETTNPPL